ncbi:MAG: hypothetical protein M3454_04805, partial [Actinomycetota bacterium]|nr:hypothetical protein [Actinomycetota bacterium]
MTSYSPKNLQAWKQSPERTHAQHPARQPVGARFSAQTLKCSSARPTLGGVFRGTSSALAAGGLAHASAVAVRSGKEGLKRPEI